MIGDVCYGHQMEVNMVTQGVYAVKPRHRTPAIGPVSSSTLLLLHTRTLTSLGCLTLPGVLYSTTELPVFTFHLPRTVSPAEEAMADTHTQTRSYSPWASQ